MEISRTSIRASGQGAPRREGPNPLDPLFANGDKEVVQNGGGIAIPGQQLQTLTQGWARRTGDESKNTVLGRQVVEFEVVAVQNPWFVMEGRQRLEASIGDDVIGMPSGYGRDQAQGEIEPFIDVKTVTIHGVHEDRPASLNLSNGVVGSGKVVTARTSRRNDFTWETVLQQCCLGVYEMV